MLRIHLEAKSPAAVANRWDKAGSAYICNRLETLVDLTSWRQVGKFLRNLNERVALASASCPLPPSQFKRYPGCLNIIPTTQS